MEVSQAQFDLGGAKDALVKARAAVHTWSPDGVRKETEPGLAIADRARARGVRALDDLRFRRGGSRSRSSSSWRSSGDSC